MAHYAVYKTDTGEIVKTIEAPEWLISDILIDDDESIAPIDRQANDVTEYIKDGKLTDKQISQSS